MHAVQSIFDRAMCEELCYGRVTLYLQHLAQHVLDRVRRHHCKPVLLSGILRTSTVVLVCLAERVPFPVRAHADLTVRI